jgi:hypothetical protein
VSSVTFSRTLFPMLSTHFLFSSFFSCSPILSLLQFLLLYSLFLSLLAGARWLALGGPTGHRASATRRIEPAVHRRDEQGQWCDEQGLWGDGAQGWQQRRRVGPARRRAGPVIKVGIMLFPCSSTYRCPSPLPFFSQGLDLMATGTWRANVGWPPMLFAVSGVMTPSLFLFFHTAIGDVPACSSGLAYKCETQHLRRVTCSSPMALQVRLQ